jgi:hypothetical protein
MQKDEVKVGMEVVVNNLPDATVYTVNKLDGWNAHLTYKVAGRTLSGGWLDVSMLQKPKPSH